MSAYKSCCRLTPDQPRALCAQDDGRLRLQLPDDLGHCYTECMQLEHDILLGRLHYHPVRPLIEESLGPHEGRVMVVTVGLHGKSGYLGTDASSLLFEAGHTTISTFRALRGERHYEGGCAVSQLRLVIGEAALQKYVGSERADQILGSGGLHRLAFRASTGATSAHASALNRYMQPCVMAQPHCHHRVDLQIHALSLLAEQFNLLAPPPPDSAPLTTDDLERIERARDILAQQLDQPLTTEYLATKVGINENKLKEGFRYLYDNTPAGVLLELRMRKAYTLLEAGQQVAQAAWQVGYKYPNNFSVAFTRYFGRSPKSIFGARRR
ncbi:helix-turn-helix domain-containing protein [Pseudothauera rhizosphaerae]|uniref:Helix-turn-helix transcriptional regulator n=1 Tax=Pseudothauera rhizosphaerae TaxID=2565932 RepID=A0A4S4ANL6_9RHOO|nr:AraC family transcriptional regulator [Pseudothauera rhizosphaerae]THF61235.1 helix-turn-helix transcriptional regulator [Pseudothauera rhizosphaerae]